MAEENTSHVDHIDHEKPHDEQGHSSSALANEVDILNITQKSPYLERNFTGTYLAICLGGFSAYGGFVMPATSLALIDEDIGTFYPRVWHRRILISDRSIAQHHLGSAGLDTSRHYWLYLGRSSL